jgi:hypothetical protein
MRGRRAQTHDALAGEPLRTAALAAAAHAGVFAGVAASLVLALGFLVTRSATAGEVQLNIGSEAQFRRDRSAPAGGQRGQVAEIRHDGEVRLFVNPIVTQDGSILLSMRVEEPSGTRWVEIGEPRIMVVNGNEAQVKVTSPKGMVYNISIARSGCEPGQRAAGFPQFATVSLTSATDRLATGVAVTMIPSFRILLPADVALKLLSASLSSGVSGSFNSARRPCC